MTARAPRLASALTLMATVGCPEPERTSSPIELSACRLPGLGVEARCGVHEVPENRAAPTGRRIRLRVAVVPALASEAEPDPLVVLVGGPGQAATGPGAQVAQALEQVRKRRDIVLVDQRGTGDSGRLSCERERPPLSEIFAPVARRADVRACREGLTADASQYVTPVAMDDLDEVRAALGYEQVNLWGASYGTRAALAYYQRYPGRVRSLVLDGVAPTEMRLPLFVPRDAQRALDRLLEDCKSDPDCSQRFPKLEPMLRDLLARDATTTEVTHPREGRTVSLSIRRAGLASAITTVLYVPELASVLPLSIEEASHGNYAPIVAQAIAFGEHVDLADGMFLSVVCNEDMARVSASDVARYTEGTFLGDEWLTRLEEECAQWPVARLPDDYFEPVVGNVPALVLSGALDPVTPPSWGALVAGRLTGSRHVIVPGAGHGVSTLGCGPELIAELLDGLNAAALDVACLEKLERPPFFIGATGPRP